MGDERRFLTDDADIEEMPRELAIFRGGAKRAPWASNPWVWVVSFKRAQP